MAGPCALSMFHLWDLPATGRRGLSEDIEALPPDHGERLGLRTPCVGPGDGAFLVVESPMGEVGQDAGDGASGDGIAIGRNLVRMVEVQGQDLCPVGIALEPAGK